MSNLIKQLENTIWMLVWADSKWKCGITQTEFKIPSDVCRGDFFRFGESFVDIGDYYYSRCGGNPILIEAPHQELAETIRNYIEKLKAGSAK